MTTLSNTGGEINAVAVDFETFYSGDCSVATSGLWHYLHDPRFDAYLVAIVGDGVRYVGPPKGFDWRRLNGLELVSHNAAFDAAVLTRLVELGVIPASVRPAAWHCTANLAAFLGAPRNLAGAAKQLVGLDVSKDLRAWMKGRSWGEAQAEGRAEELKDYVLRDAGASLAIWTKHSHRWPASERELAYLTLRMGWRGVRVDTERLEASIRHLDRIVFDAEAKLPWAEDESPILSPKSLGEHCRAAGIEPPGSLAEDSPDCEAWERSHGERFPWVAAMRDWRKANALQKKLKAMRTRTRPRDGRMGFEFKYFGAHTGRWSGGGGLNLQNLPRGESYGVDLRACLVPRPNTEFIICDLSQIEPRILAWCAGDKVLLEQIAAGVPVYEAHARMTMGWRGGLLKRENPRLYALAKARVLGLGYGCGAERFVSVAKTMGGLELGLDEARATVNGFRQSNPQIRALWNRLETSCRWSAGGNYVMNLPSGRVLTFRDVRTLEGLTAQTVMGGQHQKFYGGRLCENLVQATARDVFAAALLRLHRAGVEVIFHVHDEVVCEVPVGTDPRGIESLMSVTPDWLPGCPLAAEALVSNRYQK